MTFIIKKRKTDICLKKWKDFVHTHHYRYSNNFYDSYIGVFPRRSALVEMLTHNFNISHRTDLGFKPNMSFEELMDMLHPLLMEEEEAEPPTSKYYVKDV